ncbi:non-oxidative hydroxyarylic acid decarboxylases subunit D [Tsuneonella sp. HG094]
MSAPTCARCKSDGALTDYEGRQDGAVVWTILRCPICNFSWRDSEPASAIDPETRARDFAVDAGDLDRYPKILQQ